MNKLILKHYIKDAYDGYFKAFINEDDKCKINLVKLSFFLSKT